MLSVGCFVSMDCFVFVGWGIRGFGSDEEVVDDDQEGQGDDDDDDDDDELDEEDVSDSESLSSGDSVTFCFKDGNTVGVRTD